MKPSDDASQGQAPHDASRTLHVPTFTRDVPFSERLLVRPEEAARLLGVGRTTIYELIGKGELPVIHIGRSTRIVVRDLQLWVEQQRPAGLA